MDADELYVHVSYEDFPVTFEVHVVHTDHGCVSREQGIAEGANADGSDFYLTPTLHTEDGILLHNGGRQTFGSGSLTPLGTITPWGFCRIGDALDEVLKPTEDAATLTWDGDAYDQQAHAYREASRPWIHLAVPPADYVSDGSLDRHLVYSDPDEYADRLPYRWEDGFAVQHVKISIDDAVVTLDSLLVNDDAQRSLAIRLSSNPPA